MKSTKKFDDLGSIEILSQLAIRHRLFLLTAALILSNTIWLVKG